MNRNEVLHKNNNCLIYVIRNTINSKVYVGQTWRSLAQRAGTGYEKCYGISRAMKKYGEHNFYYEVLTVAHTQEIADYWEIYFVNYYKSTNRKFGYNLKDGGKTGFHSAKTKRKMSQSAQKRIASNECKKKISDSKKGDKNPSKKINSQIAREIYLAYLNDQTLTLDKLAEKYTINRGNIQTIIAKKAWIDATKDLPDIDVASRKNGLSKLQINEIQQKITDNQMLSLIAEEYNVSWHIIKNIKRKMEENNNLSPPFSPVISIS